MATLELHLVDVGLAARLLRRSASKLTRPDATSLQQFGHLLETFVVLELLKQASWLEGLTGTGHWRTHDGIEVDPVLEFDGGRVLVRYGPLAVAGVAAAARAAEAIDEVT